MAPKKGFSEKDLTPEQRRQFEAMKNTAAKYKGRSEGELMRELKQTVQKDNCLLYTSPSPRDRG